MEVRIYKQSAKIRCYRCGSAEIAVICHHCGRPMCADHGPVKPAMSWFTENREFKNLNLGVWPLQKEGAHCEYHVHSNINYRRVMVLPAVLILLVAGLFFLTRLVLLGNCLYNLPASVSSAGPAALAEVLRDPAVYSGLVAGQCYRPELIARLLDVFRYLLLIIYAIPALVMGIRLNKDNVASEISGRQAEVPLGLVSEGLEATEKISASMLLDASGHVTTKIVGSVWGEIHPNLRFTALDRRRLQEYRTKYGFAAANDLPFQAGFLLLGGRPQLTFEKNGNGNGNGKIHHLKSVEPRHLSEGSNMLWLEGQSSACPYLAGGKRSADPAWARSWRYRVSTADDFAMGAESFTLASDSQRDWGQVPLRVVPLLLEVGNIRSLRLQVQFNPAYFPFLKATPQADRQDISVERSQVILMEQAQVWIDPELLGRPRSSGMISEVVKEIDGRSQDVFQIDWRGLWFVIEKDISLFRLPEIRFDQPIREGAQLKGWLRVRIPALLSQMKTIQYFSALGYPINDKKSANQPFPFEGSTYLDLSFDLALAGLPVSTMTTLGGDVTEYPGAPTPKRVRAIMDALNTDISTGEPAQHIYVRRVVESTPQVSEQSGDAGRWHWDISGRNYYQTFPIDFHIVVYGHGDETRGLTHVDMSVQGQVYDQRSQEYLESTRDGLRETILRALNSSTPA